MTIGNAGLYSFMNDRTRTSFEVEGAHLSRLHQPARLVARYPALSMNKRSVLALLPSNRNELGSVSMTRHGYSSVQQHPVHVLLPGYELKGIMETPGRLELSSVFVEDEATFTPLYNCRLQAILFPDIEATSPAMLFHSGRVTAISMMKKEDLQDVS
ncbi:MAG: hypothetical protein ACLFWD_02915 [Anaerolineales bacterium]